MNSKFIKMITIILAVLMLVSVIPTQLFVTTVFADKITCASTKIVDDRQGKITATKFVNDYKRGNVEVIKVSEDGIVEDMEFRLYGTSDSGETVNLTERTDTKGRVEFKNVLTGTYKIEEINIPDSYVSPKAKSVTVEANEVSKITFDDVLKRLAIQITNIDAETGKAILYTGAGFQIFDANGNIVVIDNTDTFYTGENGTITTNIALAYGKYTLVEVEAPDGYVLDKTPTEFEINSKTIETVDGVQLVKVVKSDISQKGTITIANNDEIFAKVVEENCSYKPVFALKSLSNATYEITADEDIITADGVLRVKRGTVVTTLTTSANGTVTSEPLYLGKYTVTEIKAPYGYVLNTEPVKVELAYEGQDIDIAVRYVSFRNERQKIQSMNGKIPNTDWKEDIKTKNADIISIVIIVTGAPIILGVGYFYVIKPKISGKKKGNKKNNNK